MTARDPDVVTRNAGHCLFAGRPLHSIEEWHVLGTTWGTQRSSEIPTDAARHHGYLRDGVQVVVWSRLVTATGRAPQPREVSTT